MANTPFLNLVKPTDNDQALITDINNNSDKIDAGVSSLSDQITMLKIYTLSSGQELLTVARDTNICPINTIRWINPRNGSVSGATQFGIAHVNKRINSAISVTLYTDGGKILTNSWDDTASAWRGWQEFATVEQIANIGAKESTSGLAGTAYADITSTASNEAKIAIGKLRVYSFLITTKSSAVSPGNALLTGFDQPNDTITGGATMVIYDNSASPRTAYMGYITNTGDLVSVDTIPANHSLRGSVCYIAK